MTNLILLLISLLPFSAVLAQTVSAPKKVTYGSNPSAGKYASIRGFKMYYEVYGKGKPLLLVHGNGGSIADFKHQISYFSKSYQVIAADSRAQGKSADAGDSLSYEMMADDLDALLGHLRVDSCDFIGWSDGGINGLLLAMRHPARIKKLAITGANLWPDSTALNHGFLKWLVTTRDSLARLTQKAEIKKQKKLLELMQYQPNISPDDLKKVHCPALVIGGDHDLIFPEHTLLIARAIAKSYLWILPNSGHSTLVSHKDLFNKTVNDFFTKPFTSVWE